MNNIKSIFLSRQQRYNYLIIENNNSKRILNITKGREENKNNLIPDTYIYCDGEEYQEDIELNDIKKVSILSNIELINNSTNKNVSSPVVLLIEDINNNRLYVDVILNQTYTRKDHYRLKKFSNTKERKLYEKSKSNSIFFIRTLISLWKKLELIIAIDEEDTI